jgi:hypothetical protein
MGIDENIMKYLHEEDKPTELPYSVGDRITVRIITVRFV